MQQHQLSEYKSFFEDTPIAFVRTDLETGDFLMANQPAAKMLGYQSVSELLSHGDSTLLYPKKERTKLIQRIKETGAVEGYEIKFTLPNGKEIWVLANLHINCGGTCIEGSLLNITDQKRREKEVRSKQLKQISEISSRLDHALRA